MPGLEDVLENLKQTEKELREQNGELKAKNAALTELAFSNTQLEDFAYGAAHALHGPLRMVTNFVDLLDEETKGKLGDDPRRYMNLVRENAAKMRNMIDVLLRSSRSSGGRPLFAECQLHELVDSALTRFAQEIARVGLVVKVEELPTLWVDAAQMEEVFAILVKNALLFRGKDAPELSISSRTNEREIQVFFRDNGLGFHKGQNERVFQLFATAHNRAEFPGEGAGLAVARRILTRHGASIVAQGEPDKGATFAMTWPSHAVSPPCGVQERND